MQHTTHCAPRRLILFISKLEQAYKIDNNLDDARTLLRGIYYKLNDEENLKRVEAM